MEILTLCGNSYLPSVYIDSNFNPLWEFVIYTLCISIVVLILYGKFIIYALCKYMEILTLCGKVSYLPSVYINSSFNPMWEIRNLRSMYTNSNQK
jgi:hypothetical protein